MTVREYNFCECSEPFSLNVNNWGEEIVFDRRDDRRQQVRLSGDVTGVGGDIVDGVAYSSPRSSGAWGAALSRLRLSR